MRPLRRAVSWMPGAAFRRVVDPLLAEGALDAIELSLELAFRPSGDEAVWRRAAEGGGLLGHGVHFSPLTAGWSALDADWLARVGSVAARLPLRWVTEHFGCLRAGGVHAAPVPVPFTRSALARGRDRLARLADAVRCPVGLENLALAWSADDARAQADFVEALLEPHGLMLLDLHNLWCQAVNYRLDPLAHLERQPLHRVRGIHVAGGSWSDWPEGRFRRDTHDGPVPPPVWELLPEALARCPHVEVVILERLGPPIAADPDGFREELLRLPAQAPSATPVRPPPRAEPGDGDPAAAWDRLFRCAKAPPPALREAAAPWLDDADPRALRTAAALLQRWGRPTGPTGDRP